MGTATTGTATTGPTGITATTGMDIIGLTGIGRTTIRMLTGTPMRMDIPMHIHMDTGQASTLASQSISHRALGFQLVGGLRRTSPRESLTVDAALVGARKKRATAQV
jgi:hypothetical protein